MNNAQFYFDRPANEPIHPYTEGTPERLELEKELERQSQTEIEIPLIIGGKEVRTGKTAKVVMPHKHGHVLATYHMAGEKEVLMAIEAALEAHKQWQVMSWVERASINLKIAELIANKYRHVMNAATMLGQSKNVFQSEIDAVCETIDFIRFNAHYVSEIYNDQPHSEIGNLNRLEYRPLEGFVFAVSPFNFTSIASNLVLSPVLMGNTVVWKPATTALLSNYYLMKIYKEAGVPDGVINFVPGPGSTIGNAAVNHKDLAGIHFTGSNGTFNHLWKTVANNLENYRSYPRVVGETGGKDFVFVHPSADVDEVATALVRGAFEYQGQKCSAASRAYIPQSLWDSIKRRIDRNLKLTQKGDPKDFCNFVNAVIDEKAFNRIMGYIDKARDSKDAEILFGGKGDKSNGFYIDPTVILARDPHFITMEEEIFGPVLTIHVYPDEKFEETLQLCDNTSPYGLTGSIFSKDRYATVKACATLRYTAGNFYINDKPTGAVVGQQPFGGSRQSGTNDKAGSHLNLLRWISPRTIKETFLPPTDFRYPHMQEKKCGC
ncbi:MAG: L-glutamate gamma-semialdehyde dehydrogenase [Bacteroides sp.]|jgi:1-pyrroline-5-carboxylate dehydrogenase|nr:L-glutamate gamma-semialdehyde dehydrogenase [Bacteroides sp.]